MYKTIGRERERVIDNLFVRSIIAIVVAMALLFSGVGMALGAPDDADLTYVLDESQSEGISWFDESFEDGCYSAYGDRQPRYSYQINNGEVIEKRGFYAGGIGGLDIDLTALNLKNGDKVTIDVWHVGSNDVIDMSYKRVINVVDPNAVTEDPETPVTNGIAFDFNFKATGIQATGFNDYKEAFAALNNN